MEPLSVRRPPLRSPSWGRLLAVALAIAPLFACAEQRFGLLFEGKVAREALACLHPRGVFEAAGPVEPEGPDTFLGTITWHGELLQQKYTTRVRVRLEKGAAAVSLVEEDAVLPAVRRDCRIALDR